jgi:hypothetical protein
MTIWRMRIADRILKATNEYSEYVILFAFQLQQWLYEHASLLRYSTLLVSSYIPFRDPRMPRQCSRTCHKMKLNPPDMLRNSVAGCCYHDNHHQWVWSKILVRVSVSFGYDTFPWVIGHNRRFETAWLSIFKSPFYVNIWTFKDETAILSRKRLSPDHTAMRLHIPAEQ